MHYLLGLTIAIAFANKVKGLSPVILVPGDGGSQLEAKLHKTKSPSIICSKNADWYSLWLNLEELIYPISYCLVDNIKLDYDKNTRTTHNTPGVEIRVTGWGDPDVVEYIDPSHNSAGNYFKDIGKMLVEMGYVRKQNYFGAPYDFRKGPHEHQEFFNNFKLLVEQTFEQNQRTRVTLITHSYGSPLTAIFLRKQTATWRAKYVRRQISLAGAWAGTLKSMKAFIMGEDFDSMFVNGEVLKAAQETFSSLSFLLPSPLIWDASEVFVETPTRYYSLGNLDQFFTDLKNPNGWEMAKDSMNYTMNMGPPEVEFHCLFGDGVQTVERIQFTVEDISWYRRKYVNIINGMGDGTVNYRSLNACRNWKQTPPTTIKSYQKVDHMSILSDNHILDYIRNVLLET